MAVVAAAAAGVEVGVVVAVPEVRCDGGHEVMNCGAALMMPPASPVSPGDCCEWHRRPR